MNLFNTIGLLLFGPREKTCVQIPLDVKGKLFVSPMPFGPYDTQNKLLEVYKRHGIQCVVVLVTDDELKKKAKQDLLAIYKQNKMEALRLPVADFTSPNLEEMTRAIEQAADHLRAGAHVAIHCNAGVGRTGVVTCCLVRHIMRTSPREAIAYVKHYMQTNMTDEQIRLVERFDVLTERGAAIPSETE